MIEVKISEERLEDIKNFEHALLNVWGYGTNFVFDNPLETYLEKLARCKNIESCLYVLKKADRLTFLNELHKYKKLNDKECADMVYDIWTMQERFHNCGMSKTKLIKFMRIADKVISLPDYIERLSDDDKVTIYRGVRVNDYKGLSWTVDKSKAEWFAKRFCISGEKGYVFTGQIKKKDIIAFFDNRNEKEIVCDYRKVKGIQCEEILSK